MLYITITEYYNTKIYELDNVAYNRIMDAFIQTTGSTKVAGKLVKKFWFKTIRDLSCNSYVDIMSIFKIL